MLLVLLPMVMVLRAMVWCSADRPWGVEWADSSHWRRPHDGLHRTVGDTRSAGVPTAANPFAWVLLVWHLRGWIGSAEVSLSFHVFTLLY